MFGLFRKKLISEIIAEIDSEEDYHKVIKKTFKIISSNFKKLNNNTLLHIKNARITDIIEILGESGMDFRQVGGVHKMDSSASYVLSLPTGYSLVISQTNNSTFVKRISGVIDEGFYKMIDFEMSKIISSKFDSYTQYVWVDNKIGQMGLDIRPSEIVGRNKIII